MYQIISKMLNIVFLQAHVVTALSQPVIVNRPIIPDQRVTCISATLPIKSSTFFGQFGIVTKNHVPIKSNREKNTKILAICSKGQTLAINGKGEFYYRVVMSDNQWGYIARRFVRLMSFEAQAEKQSSLSGTVLGMRLVNTALKYQNKVFRPRIDKFEDNDFVQFIYRKDGIQLPSRLLKQVAIGYSVPTDHPKQWHPGDRFYFALYSDKIDCSAIYTGDKSFIYTPKPNYRVTRQQITSFYAKHLAAIRRSSELIF